MREKKQAATLAGIKVIDRSSILMGPDATQTLGDIGADVIKVEVPAGDINRHAAQDPRGQPLSALFF